MGVPKPQGPFRLLEGAEYNAARNAANKANSNIRRDQGLVGQPVDVHETNPVKFGGSPTDPTKEKGTDLFVCFGHSGQKINLPLI